MFPLILQGGQYTWRIKTDRKLLIASVGIVVVAAVVAVTLGVRQGPSSAVELHDSLAIDESQGVDGEPRIQSPQVRDLEDYDQTVVNIAGVVLVADIADTPEKRYWGLGVRDTMDEGEAMLFVYEQERHTSFWMNGMKFPIDIIWLDSDRVVVHIEQSLPLCTPEGCPSYQPEEEAQFVLETVAGFSEKYDIGIGTKADFNLEYKP